MTTRIQVTDTGLEVVPPRDTLTQGSENTITLEFEFAGAWLLCNEYNAVFTDDINSATVPVTGGACVVPVEVLQNPWRFVTLSLNGTSAIGVITSPFVRIGQVLPSAIGGEGGKFVTMAQLMEILHGYVKAEDLGVYVTHDELQAAIATLATQADIAQLDEAKADITTVAALAGTVSAQGVEIGNKADAATVTALETRIGTNETNIAELQNGKADKEQLEGYWSKAEIGLQTDGDGKKYLANDGEYYELQGGGGGDVTRAELDAVHDELQAEIEAQSADIAGKVAQSDFDALSETVTAQGVEIAEKASAADLTAAQADIEALQNDKADKTQLDDYETSEHAAATFAQKADIADMLTKTEAQGLYADKASMLTLENTVEAQAARIGTAETNITALQTDIAGKASDADLQALAARVGTAETNITALQADKADKTAVQALADEVAGKASAADLQAAQAEIAANTAAIATKADGDALAALSAAVADKANAADVQALSDIVDGKADESALADYWSKQEIGLQTAGTGTLFLADDGTYKPAAGDPPDLSAYLTKTEAGSTYETQAHAAETYATKADIPDVSGFETTEHAAATYASKAELSDKADSATVTALSGVVTGHSAEIAALQTTKADKSEIPDVSGFETAAHADATYAKKTELPDVSDMLTKTEAAGTYATASALTGLQGDVETNTAAIAENASDIAAAVLDIQTLGNTVASKADAATVTTLQTDVQALGEAMNGKASAADLTALQTEVAGKASQAQVDTVAGDVQTLRADVDELDVAQNALDGRVTAAETEIANNTAALAGKVDTATLADYETTAHASATYATKAEIPDVSGFETTTHAEATYLKISDAAATYLTIADASPIKSITQALSPVPPDANGNVNIRFVYVSSGYKAGKRTLFVRSASRNINFGDNLLIEFAENSGKQSDCEIYSQYTDETTQGDKVNAVRIATKDELTDATAGMATQTWVQQYVASLDGTNIAA